MAATAAAASSGVAPESGRAEGGDPRSTPAIVAAIQASGGPCEFSHRLVPEPHCSAARARTPRCEASPGPSRTFAHVAYTVGPGRCRGSAPRSGRQSPSWPSRARPPTAGTADPRSPARDSTSPRARSWTPPDAHGWPTTTAGSAACPGPTDTVPATSSILQRPGEPGAAHVPRRPAPRRRPRPGRGRPARPRRPDARLAPQRRRGRPDPRRRLAELGGRAGALEPRHPGLFEFRDTITMLADRGRPTSLSLGPDGAVYVGFQRETTIQRIRDAATTPGGRGRRPTSARDSAQSVAAGRDADGRPRVYLAEPTGLSVLHPVDGVPPPRSRCPSTSIRHRDRRHALRPRRRQAVRRHRRAASPRPTPDSTR